MMRLRTCSNFHFIRAIKDGLVTKIHNVDSRGMPGLTFKKLEDISGVSDIDVAGPPIVDRNTRERGAETTEFGFNGEYVKEECDSDELDFGEITLIQLKKKCKTKKRKAAEPVLLIPKQEPGDLEPDEDDLDLKQSLSSWKSKLSKSPKSKKRAKKISLTSHEDALSLNSEQIQDAEDALQSSDYLCLKITVKDECQEAEDSDSENMIHITDSPIRNQQTNFCGEEESGKNNETANCNSKGIEPICAVSEVSYDHLEHIEPRFPLTWDGEENIDMGQWEMRQQPLVLPASEFKGKKDVNNSPLSLSYMEIVSSDRNQSPRTYDSSQSCPDMQVVVLQVNEDKGVEVSEMITDNDLCSKGLGVGKPCMFKDDAMEVLPQNQGNVSPSSSINNSCSTWKWDSCLSPENEVFPVKDDSPSTMKKPLLTSTSADTSIDYLNSKHHLAFLEDASHMHEEKQPLVPISADSESKVSTYSYPSDTVSQPSSSEIKNYHINELRQLSERLPSTRKVISPTSQEKLCLAMNSCESFSDIDLYKCKEKLYFGKEAVGKASLAGLDIKQSTEKSCHPKGPEEVIPMKVTINPKQILKKQKNDKKCSPPSKGSPPNGCLEGPRLCRSLPHLSTGCKSIQACSESAIAFSQRQMQDIESLALKLMTELKSMKDIVEEKLLYESYRSTSLKNDADEVKVAIKTAVKTEETARKWLSMMARDCTRFCKIMKLTDNDAPAFESTIQENTAQREKKINFADEAGGMLCNIKFFEDGIASQESRRETIATS